MLCIAFIIGVIMGNATKAHLYAKVCDTFYKAMVRKENRIKKHIYEKVELRKELERLSKS